MFVPNSSVLRTINIVGIAIVSVIGVASCSNDDATQPIDPVESPSTSGLADPVPILHVDTSVEFYPACGNETLDHAGRTWYPIGRVGVDSIDASLQDKLDAVRNVDREEPPVATTHGLARVAPPGPGDGIGTMVVWADGVARWTSDSGDLVAWMIDEEITYNWVC